MRKIITISTQTISNAVFVCKKLPKTALMALFATLLSIGVSSNVSAQCSNMTLNNVTPPWNGFEFCDNGSGYNPAAINAPTINYVGSCTNTPSYTYVWEYRVNFNPTWTTVSSGSGSAFVPGYDPPAQFNSTPGSPLNFYQWRITVTDVANGGQTAQSGNYTVSIGSQMTGTTLVTPITCVGANDASINLTVNGGLTNKTYSWSTGATTEDISGLAPGTYTVTVTDGGCAAYTTTATVTTNPSGTVHNINSGKNFCSIQAAINDANTNNGDTINVDAGTFAENIVVSKSVKIFGPNKTVNPCSGSRVAEAIVVPGTNSVRYGEIFHVAASNVTISGFTINGDNSLMASGATNISGADLNAAEGITVYETGINNLTATNNIIKNLSYFGITLYDYPAGVPSTGHVISNNKILDLGTYNDTNSVDNINFWGGAVLLYNNQYAAVTNNCIDQVRIGVQTGNYSQANPGTSASQVISGNTMTNVRRRGIFHNLAYSSASPYTLSNNTISGVSNVNETNWSGILISSMSVASTTSGNTINGITSTNPTSGIEVWNVKSSSPAAISGGSVNGVTNGVFVNNYDGYPTAGSDATDGGNATLSGTAISGCTNGIYVKDNASSTHAAVNLAIGAGVTVTGGTTGLKIENSAASVGASISDLSFSGQSGNYITLVSNANNFSATSASFGGNTGATATLAQNYAIEDKISHKTDNGALGFVRVKATNVFVTTNSGSIQRGVDAATATDVVNVNSGSFNEDVNINKQVTLMGAGCGNTTVSGPIGGQGTTFLVGAAGVIIDGFSITRDGNNTTDWNNAGLNTAGISVQGLTNSAEIRNNCLNGLRTGIDINNSNGNNIHNNTIDNNRTGMIFRNQTDNTNVSENFITNNWTAGVLFLDGSLGSNSPVQTAANSTFNNNNISGNWYGEVVDRQTGGSLLAPGTNMKNFDCNWYGATSQPVTTTANSAELGYAALIPVIYGGTATAPGGQPDIAGPASANIDFVSWLVDGTDNAGTNGFQPVSGSCSGTPISITSAVTTPTSCGVTGTINMVFTGGTTPYTVAWSGAATGSQSAAASPSLISSLVNGTYTVTITDVNGTTASTVAVVDNLPVKNTTANTFHATIQAGIDAASANDVLEVCTGTYNENININKALTVKGPNAAISCVNGTRDPEATIAALGASGTIAVTISADNVQLLGFNISNANGSFGVYSKGNSNVLIENNIVSNIGNNTTGSAASYGISIEAGSAANSAGINIAHNCVSNIRGGANTSLSGAAAKANNGSGVGIGAGFSTAAFDINGLAIYENLITNITASTVAFSDGGKGAYGININVGANTSPAAAGKANASVVAANDISNLEGLWAHGIGLEGETPNAIVLNNTINNLIDHKGNTDAIGVLIEDNPGSATVIISENSFTNMAFGVKNTTTPTVNAECNWFGGMTNAIVSSKNTGNVDYNPWLVNGSDNNSTVLGFQPVSGSCTGTPVSLSETHSNVSCNGGSNGSINLTVSGGTTPYSFAWSNAAVTEDLSGLSAGTYSVLVTDANGSTATLSINITEPAVLAATGTQVNEPCNGNSLGSINLSVTGGTTSYSYAWSNSESTEDLSGLSAGTYSVLVTDANGCSTTAAFTITEPAVLNTVATKDNDVICNGMNNGSATAHATGGTTPYSFLWDDANAQTDSNAVNLAPGTYNVLVTDAHGCTTVASVTIIEPSALTGSATATNHVSCFGGNNGSASTSVSGGTAPYTYTWSNGQTTSSVSGLIAGTYTVTIVDSHLCQIVKTVTINQPTAFTSSASGIINVSCNGLSDGSASVTPNGGTAPYTYVWSDNQSTQTAINLSAGVYNVVVTDANGCTSSTSATITQPDAMGATINVIQNVSCFGGSNGSATAVGTGGSIPYTYAWSNSTVLANATGLAAGTYSVIISDGNGCSATASTTISQPTAVGADITVDNNVSCFGLSDGSVTAAGTGGTAPYTYAWSSGSNGATANGLAAGPYTLTVTDAHSCTYSTVVTITEPVVLTTSISASNDVSCNGGSDGSATASSNGGTPSYTYAWSNGNTNAIANGLVAGFYTYTVTDGHGCTATGSVTINQPTALVASSSLITAVQCHGGTATISVGATGGSAPYTGTGTYTVTAGPHTYTVTDDHGCTSSTTITVTEPDALVASATQGSPILCHGGTTTVTVGATGGTPTYTGTGTFTVGAGTHSYNVTDANGCTSSASITISEPDQLVASSAVTTPIHCNGGTGVVTVSAIGGTTPYTGATTYTVSAGSYTYTVTDNNGCTSSTTITVTQPAVITGASSEHACDTYSWNSNTYTTSGVYVGHFPAANGCDSVHTLTLTVGYSSASSSTVTQSLSYTWPVNGVTYTLSGTYTATSLNGTGCTQTNTLNLTILGVTIVNARVFLDGAYDPNLELMTDSLRVNGLIPSTEPYTAAPYNRTPINDPSGKNLAPGVLTVSGPNAIVDWILLEVRSTTSPYPVIATRRCLVQRDGEIVDTNGVSPVLFASVPVGAYYMSVKHRNHLGVMLATPQTLTLAGGPVDFTQQALWTKPSIPAIVNTPAKSYGLTQVLWAGDALYNKNVKYNGASNDKDVVLTAVGAGTPNNVVAGYRPEDVNLDGVVKYNNTNADRLIILNTVGVATPNRICNQHTPD